MNNRLIARKHFKVIFSRIFKLEVDFQYYSKVPNKWGAGIKGGVGHEAQNK